MNYRYQVALKQELVDHLKRTTGVENNKELLNEALLLLEWAVEEASHGRSIGSIDEDKSEYKEIVLPSLRAARARSKGGEKVPA